MVRTYLYGIAVKVLAVERRRVKKDSSPGMGAPPRYDSPESEFWIREALERLDPSEREILMLREYE